MLEGLKINPKTKLKSMSKGTKEKVQLVLISTHLLSGTSVGLYFIALFGLVIMTAIFLIMRFYKKFLTDEVYLTFILLVKTSTLIISKQINGIIWNNLL